MSPRQAVKPAGGGPARVEASLGPMPPTPAPHPWIPPFARYRDATMARMTAQPNNARAAA